MTNNYFLHTESLKAKSFEDYQTGMGKLIEIKFRCNQDEHILKHEIYIIMTITYLYVSQETTRLLQL